MTDTHRDTRRESFYAQRASIVSPSADRPWLLVALAVACIAAVIAGSLGPWIEYERVSETAPAVWHLSGRNTDGLFSFGFASVALIALGIALFRTDAEAWAWVAFGGMALCAVIGVFDWIMLVPPQQVIPPGGTGTVERLDWGAKVVGVAGPLGALVTFLIARRLNASEF